MPAKMHLQKCINENHLHPLFIISKIIFHKINLFFFSIFSEMTNETNCPYCPPGMECDPATYTCVKGSYKIEHLISIFHFLSIFYSV